MVSFTLCLGTSVFSQDLNTTKTVKERPIQKEEKSLNQAQPLSTKGTVSNSKNTGLNSARGEVQVLDRKTVKNQPAKTDL